METKMDGTQLEQAKAIKYYDQLSVIYDIVSNWYYKKSRNYAIQELHLMKDQTILNLPCGTGLNFKYFQNKLNNSGPIIGIDLSNGMLNQSRKKIKKNNWNNILLFLDDATKINQDWIDENLQRENPVQIDAVFCDLGLSGLPDWQNIIDNMLSILKPNGRIVILDWYIENPGLRGSFIKWIGKGEVDRPLWQYLETKVADFKVDDSFNYSGVFVASGFKR